jgi:transposase
MLGIDVSKHQLVCSLFDPATHQCHWEKTVLNTPEGVSQLLSLTPAAAPWVLEPTGRYSLGVAQQARTAGRTVLLAPPKKAKAYLASLQSRAKTDSLDSRGLALFALTRPRSEPLRPYPIRSESVERLSQLLAARRQIVAALASLQQQLVELPHAAAPLKEAIAALQEQRKELDRQIARLTQDDAGFPETRRLQAVPGIGPVTAATLLTQLKERHFPDSDAFVAFIGLDVRVLASGPRRGELGITKQGDAELRRLLYLCAQATLCCKDAPFKAQYDRELKKGLAKTAALCAVARKLARVCWAIVHYGMEYDPHRVYHQPTRSQPVDPQPITDLHP